MIAREKWLGCRHDASLMFDIPGSTPVWALYLLFFDFLDIKIYMLYKRTLVVSDLVLARQRSENAFDRP